MDTTLNVPSIDYFHSVKALRTLSLSINSQKCWGSLDPNQNVMKNSNKCISLSHILEWKSKTTLIAVPFQLLIKRDLSIISQLLY